MSNLGHPIVHAIFPNYRSVHHALETLTNSGFSTKQFSVIGQDSDNFRDATWKLTCKRLDEFIFGLGLVGIVVGALAGFVGYPTPHAVVPVESQFLSMLAATAVGALLGMLTGCLVGAVLRVDSMPATDATFRSGTIVGGNIAISVKVEDTHEASLAKSVFIENGATYLSVNPGEEYRTDRDS
jgi:hypothetical protein